MKKSEKPKQQRERRKPSKLPKKRYILFELRSEERLHWRAVRAELEKISALLIKFNSDTGKGIMRCRLQELQQVKRKFMAMRRVQNAAVKPKTLLTSGTVKKLRNRI